MSKTETHTPSTADLAAAGHRATEDLRVALQRYRSFFGRLLAV